MKLTISQKVNLLSIIIVILFSIILAYNLIQHETNAIEGELKERAEVMLNSTELSIEYPLLVLDIDSIAKIIQGVIEQKDVVYCLIEDKNGKIAYQKSNNVEKPVREFEKEIQIERMKGGMGEDIILGEQKKEVEVIGKIKLGISLKSMIKKLDQATNTIVGIVIIMLILTIFFNTLLLKIVLSKPISMLVNGTEKIAAGELNYKVNVGSNDEIGFLASAFNKMTTDLQKVTVSRDHVDGIINSMSDSLVVINPDKTIQSINKPTISLLGYERSELEGKSIHYLLFSEHVYPFEVNGWKKLIEEGIIRDCELELKARNEEIIPISLSGSVMKDKDGKAKYIICVLRDMREMLKLKKQLIQSEKMAAVGQLAGGVAHEINNPMSVILGFAQSLARNVKDEKNPMFLPVKSIEREAIRCKKLVSDLLTFTRIPKSESETVETNALLQETVSLIETKTKVSNVEVITELTENVVNAVMNKNQIQQVIVNICNNAIDAMPQGGQLRLAVKEHSRNNKSFVEIRISDTGTGIPSSVKDKMFEPFFTTKEVGKGTGLGLSISYEIVKKHNGDIEVKSEVNKGTEFIITLPKEE